MVVTWVTHAVATIFVGIVSANGGYRHSYYLEKEQLKFVTKINVIGEFPGNVCQLTGKTAICFLFLRVFGPISKWRKSLIWLLMILNIVDCVISIIITYAQCSNPAALWDPELMPTTRCWDAKLQNTAMIIFQALNCCFDFILASIPVTFIWGLRFSLLKKIGLVLSLSGGYFSGICAAFKVKSITVLIQRADFPRATFSLYVWASTEICVIILCGCIPTLMPLWDRFEKNFRSFITKSQPSSSRAPQERRQRPTCRVRRVSSLDLTRSVGRSDTVVSSLGAKAFDDDSNGTQSTCSQNTRSIISRQDEATSIQVTRSFQVDYSVSQEG